jgi:hypothetical protein
MGTHTGNNHGGAQPARLDLDFEPIVTLHRKALRDQAAVAEAVLILVFALGLGVGLAIGHFVR